MGATLFMQTTEVPAERSAAEITSLLVQSGARRISTDYAEAKVVGIHFVLTVANREFTFELPARVEPLYRLLVKQRPFNANFRSSRSQYEQDMQAMAERVGWRQLFRWVQAQLAMIQTGMVSSHEVFLPYLITGRNRTMLQEFEEKALKMLPEASPAEGDAQ